jgi:probable F420-dependent oxidoreductase
VKIDTFLADGLAAAPGRARHAEVVGYDAVWSGEVAHDPLLPLAAAAVSTTTIQLGTSIAVAFARSPMSVAYQAWDLAEASRGRFVLGLGTQIKAHIQRRFSMPWHEPVAQMRDYIQALRAIFATWQDGAPLAFEGDYYSHNLMTPVFNPGPLPEGHQPSIALAVVGGALTRLAGEACDGVILHAFSNSHYVDDVTLPALDEGVARSPGKDRPWIMSGTFLVTGDTEEEQEASEARARKQLAFYASTPAYVEVLRVLGQEELQRELLSLSKQGRWDEMAELFEPQVADHFILRGTLEELPEQIIRRFHGRADRIFPYFPLPDSYEPERVSDFIAAVHKAGAAAAAAPATVQALRPPSTGTTAPVR